MELAVVRWRRRFYPGRFLDIQSRLQAGAPWGRTAKTVRMSEGGGSGFGRPWRDFRGFDSANPHLNIGVVFYQWFLWRDGGQEWSFIMVRLPGEFANGTRITVC